MIIILVVEKNKNIFEILYHKHHIFKRHNVLPNFRRETKWLFWVKYIIPLSPSRDTWEFWTQFFYSGKNRILKIAIWTLSGNVPWLAWQKLNNIFWQYPLFSHLLMAKFFISTFARVEKMASGGNDVGERLEWSSRKIISLQCWCLYYFPPKDNVLAIKLAILLQFLEQPYHHQGWWKQFQIGKAIKIMYSKSLR